MKDQYSTTGTITTENKKPRVVSEEQRVIHSLENKIATLEAHAQDQRNDLLKLQREIARIKNDIDTLTSAVRKR